MSQMFTLQCGVVSLRPDFQMSNALSHPSIVVEDQHEWQKRYWELCFSQRGAELPMPCMWKNYPCFTGGLKPQNFPILNPDEQIYVCNFKLQYRAVNISDIRLPNDREYAKHFKSCIEKKTYRIKHSYGTKYKPNSTQVVLNNMKERAATPIHGIAPC